MPLLFEFDNAVTIFGVNIDALAMTRLADGRLLFVGHDAGVNSIRFAYFDEFDELTGPFDIELINHDPVSSVVALSNGGFAIVYGTLGGDREIYMELYTEAGVAIGSPVHVNTVTSGNQVTPQATALGSGRILVTWTDQSGLGANSGHGIKARIFESNGTPVGGEFLVNTTVAGDQLLPEVLALAGGGFVIAWQDPASLGKFQLFDAAGNRIGAEIDAPMSSLFGLSNGNFMISHDGTGTARIYDPSGNPVITVTGVGIVMGAMAGGFLSSRPDGREAIYDNFGAQQGVGFESTGNPTNDMVMALDDGRFITVGYGGGAGMFYFKPDDGVLTLTPPPVSISETLPQNSLIGLVAIPDGAVNNRYTYSVVSDSLGGGFRIEGNRLILNDIAGLDYETMPTVSITVRATDFFGATVTQVFELNVFDQALEYPITASPAMAHTMDTTDRGLLELPSGGHVLARTAPGVDGNGNAVTVQSFDADGNPTSAVIQVNTNTVLNQQAPDIAALDSGRFMIAWWDESGDAAGGLKYQLFDSALNKVGTEVALNTVTAGSQIDVALQQLGSGRVLATWTDYSGVGGDTASGGIKGRLFDSAGAPIGGEFLVNGVVDGEQRKSDIVALASGNVLVTWASIDGSSFGTFRGQLFDSNGVKIGGEIVLESFNRFGSAGTYGGQNSGGYKVVALPDGGFALAWTTQQLGPPDGSGTTSVWARLFDDNGAPANAKFIVNTVPNGNQRIAGMTVLPDGELYIAWDNEGSSSQARMFDLTATRTVWFTNDTLAGTPGADMLAGGFGNDTYIVGHAGDVVVEQAFEGTDIIYSGVSYSLNDTYEVENLSTLSWQATDALNLTGNGLNNTLIGNAGANQLNGGLAADSMIGREGNDTYFVDNVGDRAIEQAGQGTDIVYTSINYTLPSNIENLSTISWQSTYPLNLTGNGLANTLIGNAGRNQLDGAAGADTMIGREGNDVYFVDSAGDRPTKSAGQGADIVYTSISYTLASNSDVESLATISFTATTALNLTGNQLANTLIGNDGNNQIDGTGGADVMVGRAGNDKYLVDNVGDKVFEAAGGGQDVVFTGVSVALTNDQEIEGLSSIDWNATYALNLTGNSLRNNLIGNAGANVLDGKAGNDTLQGREGADTYAFTTLLGATNIDLILGFSAADDTIVLENNGVFTGLATGALPGTAFVIGTAAQDLDDRIVYNQATGQLFFDADGSGAGAQVQFARLDGAPIIAASDFTVI